MAREFASHWYEIADTIAEKMAAGISEDKVMIQVGNRDFARYCLMHLRDKCPKYWRFVPNLLLLPIAQLVVMAMMRQHELDGGKVPTLDEIIADWRRALGQPEAAAEAEPE
jgi:hypothetical protein